MGSRIEVPRISISSSTFANMYELPEEIRNRIPPTPDHIEEARRECVHEFLERVLLPRVRDNDKPLTAEELATAATKFKLQFHEEHPNDFDGKYEVIPAAEMELLELRFHYVNKKNLSRNEEKTVLLIQKAATEFKNILDNNLENLISI